MDGVRIVWLNNQRLVHIDLNDFHATVVKDYFTVQRCDQFRFMANTMQDGLIYFLAEQGLLYVVPHDVGVMDAYTGEVLWHQRVEESGGFWKPPQMTGGKLYALSNLKVLYIFEKEAEA